MIKVCRDPIPTIFTQDIFTPSTSKQNPSSRIRNSRAVKLDFSNQVAKEGAQKQQVPYRSIFEHRKSSFIKKITGQQFTRSKSAMKSNAHRSYRNQQLSVNTLTSKVEIRSKPCAVKEFVESPKKSP